MDGVALRESVIGIAAAVLGTTRSAVTSAGSLAEIPGFNSFRMVELVERLEREFEVELDPDDLVPEHLGRLDRLCVLFDRAMTDHREGVVR